MVNVSVEVHSGAAHFSVAVRAESIRLALRIVGERYPGGDIGVKFPIDPEGFFVEEAAARAMITGDEQPRRMAA